MQLNINIRITKQVLVIVTVILLAAAGSLLYLKSANSNPLPKTIKDRVNFKIIYPRNQVAPIKQNSYRYQQNVLSFQVRFAGADIAFSEQRAPESLGSGDQIYYPTLGIHPYAQFKTDQGPVALTKFWESGSLQPVGQAGVLAAKGTLLTAHSDKILTNQQWKDLFENLKVTP